MWTKLAGAGAQVSTSSASSLSGAIASGVPIASVVFLAWAVNAAGITCTTTDAVGSAWIDPTPISGTNLSAGFAYCLRNNGLVNGAVTCTWSSSVPQAAFAADVFKNDFFPALDGTFGSFASDAASPYATSNQTAVLRADDLGVSAWCALTAAASGYSFTSPAGFTAGAAAGGASNLDVRIHYKANMASNAAWSAQTAAGVSPTLVHGFAVSFSDTPPLQISRQFPNDVQAI